MSRLIILSIVLLGSISCMQLAQVSGQEATSLVPSRNEQRQSSILDNFRKIPQHGRRYLNNFWNRFSNGTNADSINRPNPSNELQGINNGAGLGAGEGAKEHQKGQFDQTLENERGQLQASNNQRQQNVAELESVRETLNKIMDRVIQMHERDPRSEMPRIKHLLDHVISGIIRLQ